MIAANSTVWIVLCPNVPCFVSILLIGVFSIVFNIPAKIRFLGLCNGDATKKLPHLEQLFALFGNPELVLSLDVVHADLDGLHVQRDELVGAFRQAVAQTLFDVLVVDDGANL